MTQIYRRYSYDETTCRAVQKRRLSSSNNGRQTNFTTMQCDHTVNLLVSALFGQRSALYSISFMKSLHFKKGDDNPFIQ